MTITQAVEPGKFSSIEPVAGMRLRTQHGLVVELVKLSVMGPGVWESIIVSAPQGWQIYQRWYMFRDDPATVVSPDPDTIHPPQKDEPKLTYTEYEQRARQLMQKSYERGKCDGKRQLIDSIRSAFGQDLVNMILEYADDNQEVAG